MTLVLISDESRVYYRLHTVMGLAELLECSARLCPTKESLHILVGEAEHGGAVTLGIFISTMCRGWNGAMVFRTWPRTYFESLR
jgi:hypothetical protein